MDCSFEVQCIMSAQAPKKNIKNKSTIKTHPIVCRCALSSRAYLYNIKQSRQNEVSPNVWRAKRVYRYEPYISRKLKSWRWKCKKPILNWSNHFREICMFIQQNLMNFHGKVSLFQNWLYFPSKGMKSWKTFQKWKVKLLTSQVRTTNSTKVTKKGGWRA